MRPRSFSGGGAGGGFGGGLVGPIPRDIWILTGVVFFSLALRYFAATAALPELLSLTSRVWRSGFLWQLLTYPFIGIGSPGIWFVIELVILVLFTRTVYRGLGRERFWQILLSVTLIAGLAGVVVDLVMSLAGAAPSTSLVLMQGQRMLLTIVIAAFATLYRSATIYLFFVLPVEARWFLLLEVVFAFLALLNSKDFPGFVGICTGVGTTYLMLDRGVGRAGLRQLWLSLQERWFRYRLRRMRQRRGIHLVDDKERDGGRKKKDPWVN